MVIFKYQKWFKNKITNDKVILSDNTIYTKHDMFLLFYLKDKYKENYSSFVISRKNKQYNTLVIKLFNGKKVKQEYINFANIVQEYLLKRKLDYSKEMFYLFDNLQLNKKYKIKSFCIKNAKKIIKIKGEQND